MRKTIIMSNRNRYQQKDILIFSISSILLFLIIPILIAMLIEGSNLSWLIFYYIDAIVLCSLLFDKFIPVVLNRNFQGIEENKAKVNKLKYDSSEPNEIFSKYFYKYHELINYYEIVKEEGKQDKGQRYKSLFEMGKFGYTHLFIILAKLFLYTLFIWLFFHYYEPTAIFFLTILGVAFIEILSAVISFIDFWRKIYSAGKDNVILEERILEIEKKLKMAED